MSVRRGHHQVILPSSSARRNCSRAEGGRLRDELPHPRPILRAGRCRLEIPFEVRLLERCQISTLDGQSVALTKRSPCAGRKQPMVARVAKFFDLMQPLFRFGCIVFHASVDEQKPTTRHEHARGFGDERLGGGKVMRRDA